MQAKLLIKLAQRLQNYFCCGAAIKGSGAQQLKSCYWGVAVNMLFHKLDSSKTSSLMLKLMCVASQDGQQQDFKLDTAAAVHLSSWLPHDLGDG